MESSARMRRCVRRDNKGSDHFGAAAIFELGFCHSLNSPMQFYQLLMNFYIHALNVRFS